MNVYVTVCITHNFANIITIYYYFVLTISLTDVIINLTIN